MGGLRRLLWGSLGLALLSGLGLLLVAGGPRGLLDALVSMGPGSLALGLAALFAADLVRVARLLVLARMEGLRVRASTAMIARLFGRFAGVLTPAYTGSTPARAAVISAFDGIEPGKSMALATIESAYDSLLPVAITLALSIPLLPSTLLPTLVSLFILLMWVGGLSWGRSRGFEEAVRRRLPEGLACYILRQREHFYTVLGRSVRPSSLLPVLAITLASHIVEALGVLAIVWGVRAVLGAPEAVFRSFLALEVSHVMVMSPTPGGALFFEYGVASVLPPEATVHWRILYITYSLLPGGILLIIFPRLREYARTLGSGGDAECSDL